MVVMPCLIFSMPLIRSVSIPSSTALRRSSTGALIAAEIDRLIRAAGETA